MYLNGQNQENWKHTVLPEAWSNKNSHQLPLRMQNGTDALCDRSVISYRTKYILTIWSSNHSFWYLPNKSKICVHPKTCTRKFTEALVIISKTWKQLKMPFKKQMDPSRSSAHLLIGLYANYYLASPFICIYFILFCRFYFPFVSDFFFYVKAFKFD